MALASATPSKLPVTLNGDPKSRAGFSRLAELLESRMVTTPTFYAMAKPILFIDFITKITVTRVFHQGLAAG